jgi:hypothetical protein
VKNSVKNRVKNSVNIHYVKNASKVVQVV